MSFNLTKGSSFALAKATTKFRIGLGWDENPTPVDLDAIAFGCISGENGPKMFNGGSHAIGYFNKVKSNPNGSFETLDGSLHHSGDDLSGGSSKTGADETITVDVSKLPAEINEIPIFLVIYEAVSRRQSFGDVQNAYVDLVNDATGEVLCKYDLTHEFAGNSAVQVGSLVKAGDSWKFDAVGAGFSQDLSKIIEKLS